MKSDTSARVLVTGATGFLGRNILMNILKALMANGELDVIAACRSPANLIPEFKGEVRKGDLLDQNYRLTLFENIDVACGAGTWASVWGHENQERKFFYEPTCDLLEQAIRCGVRRFLQTRSVVVAPPPKNDKPLDDFA